MWDAIQQHERCCFDYLRNNYQLFVSNTAAVIPVALSRVKLIPLNWIPDIEARCLPLVQKVLPNITELRIASSGPVPETVTDEMVSIARPFPADPKAPALWVGGGVYSLTCAHGLKVGMSSRNVIGRVKNQLVPGMKVLWVFACFNARRVEDSLHSWLDKQASRLGEQDWWALAEVPLPDLETLASNLAQENS